MHLAVQRAAPALALALWLLALAGATAGFFVGRSVYERGVVYGNPGPPMLDLDGPQRAINTQLEVEADAVAQQRALRLIREAGFGWIRQQFAWADLEVGGKGQFFDYTAGRPTWARYDQIVDQARAEGLRVIARLDLPPDWSRPPGSYKTHPPVRLQDYADFVAAFTERYRGRIDYVQLWNEPNLRNEWGNQPVDPAGYVALLRAGYEGAKRGNPQVRVVSGELAQTLEPDSPDAAGLDDLLFLDRMYAFGARPYFDVLAANAYGLRTGPQDRQIAPRYTNFPRVVLAHEIMLRHGDGGKPVWITEFGWNALPPGWQGDPSPWGQVSPAQQGAYLTGAYSRARAEWPWLGPMAMWLFRQPQANSRDPTPYFGLVGADWQPRPAYEALKATAAPVAGVGVHQETADALQFEGTWQWTAAEGALLGGLRETPISGATLSFRFRGTTLELLAPYGPTRGIAHVTVDGSYYLANRVSLNPAGQAAIDFYAPRAAQQRRVTIADGLPDREHTFELLVTGWHAPEATDPGVGLDAVIVSRARPALPLAGLAAIWGIAAVAAAWVVRPRVVGAVSAAVFPGRGGRVLPVAGPTTAVAYAGAAGSLGAESADGDLGRAAVPPRFMRGALQPYRPHAPLIAVLLWLPWRRLAVFAAAAALSLAPLTVRSPAGHYSPLELLALALVAASAARLYWSGTLGRWRGAFAGPAALLVGSGILSLAVAAYPRLGLRELRTLVVEPVLFYLCARAALRGVGDARRLVWCLLGGAGAASVIALAETVTHRGLVQAEGVARAAALYPSPNNLALLLDRAVPLAVALAVYGAVSLTPGLPPTDGRGETASGNGDSGDVATGALPLSRLWERGLGGEGNRWLAAAAVAVVCAVALFFTFSSSAWLATALGIAVVLAPAAAGWMRRHGRRARVGATAGAAAGLLALAAVALRFGRLRASLRPEGTGALRLYVWDSAWRMVKDHPLTGVGLDQFLYQYAHYIHPEASREPGLSHPHNLVLDFWLRLGVPGLLFLGWTALIVAARLRAGLRQRQRGESQPGGRGGTFALVAGVAGSLAAALAHGLVDNSYFVLDLAYAFWILVLVLELCTDGRGERDAHGHADPPA